MRERQPTQQPTIMAQRPAPERQQQAAAGARSGVGSESVMKALREWEQRKAADHVRRARDKPTP